MDFELYKTKLEVELYNYIVIWIVVLLSLIYCYVVGSKISKGFKRFISVSPIIILFLHIPWNLYSAHLSLLTVFPISWLANSKLLLFAFDNGPLSSNPSISLPVFLAVASLPIKIKQNQSCPNQSILAMYPFKVLFLAIVMYIIINHGISISHYNPMILSCIGLIQFYLEVDFIFTSVSTLVGSILGLDLEPSFNEPYLSTSLQDFWTRWNRMASNILKITIYQPMKNMFAGRRWATAVAVVTTFTVSGLFHELMYYHWLHENPTGESTFFFVIHGVYVAIEIEVKKRFRKWHFEGHLVLLYMYRLWTFVMVFGLGSWLLCAPVKMSETHLRLMHEYRALINWISH